MIDSSGESQLPIPVAIGEKLPGLLLQAEERPEGINYWDQVISSPYGNLFYAPDQFRNGMLRWVTNHGEVCIRVKSGSGEVVDIDTEAQVKYDDFYGHIYEMGMEAYRELKQRIAGGEDPRDLA